MLLLMSIRLMAQTAEPCEIQDIQTHPSEAQNIPPNLDGSPKRLIDWQSAAWEWQTMDAPPYWNTTIKNPHGSAGAAGNLNMEMLKTDIVSQRDNQVEDGWELLAYNDGSLYHDNPRYTGASRRNDYKFPYFILYNKYRSIIRVFYQFDKNQFEQDYDQATIRIKFLNDDYDYNRSGIGQAIKSKNQSANFNEFGAETKAIDSFNKKVHAQFANIHVDGNDNQWFWADFPIAYDPCVCQFEYQKMWVSIDLIDQADVTLTGTNTTSDLLKEPGSATSMGSDLAMGIAGGTELGRDLTKAMKVYKNDQTFVNNIAGLFNRELKGDKKKDLLKDSNGTLKSLAEIGKALPYVGFAFSLIDNLVSDTKAAESKPTQVSFTSTIDLEGYITYKQINAINALLKVPGSKNPSNLIDIEQPLYDEPLGIITLMETPVLEYVDYYADANEIISQNNFHGPDNIGTKWTFTANNWIPFIRQYRPKNIPKVAINPAAGLELIDLRFTYRIVAHKRDLAHYDASPSVMNSYTKYFTQNFTNDLNSFGEKFEVINLGIGQNKTVKSIDIPPYPIVDFMHYYPTDTSAAFFDPRMKISGLEFEQWNYNPGNQYLPYFIPRSTLEESNHGVGIVNTNYLPYGYLPYQTFYTYRGYELSESRYNYRNYSEYEIKPREENEMPKMELKIVAIFKRQDDPQSENIIVQKVIPATVVEADVEQDSCSVSIEHLDGASKFNLVSPNGWQQPMWLDLLRLPFDIVLEDTTVGPVVIQVLNNIYIGDNVTIAPGTTFYAGNAIESTGSPIDIPPTTVMEVRPPLGVTPIQPQNYLLYDATSYCVDKDKYNPEVLNKRLADAPSRSNQKIESMLFDLHPNPAHHRLYISGIDPKQIDKLVCMDALGRCVQEWNGYDGALDVQDLRAGIYFIQLSWKNGTTSKSKKLIISN